MIVILTGLSVKAKFCAKFCHSSFRWNDRLLCKIFTFDGETNSILTDSEDNVNFCIFKEKITFLYPAHFSIIAGIITSSTSDSGKVPR